MTCTAEGCSAVKRRPFETKKLSGRSNGRAPGSDCGPHTISPVAPETRELTSCPLLDALTTISPLAAMEIAGGGDPEFGAGFGPHMTFPEEPLYLNINEEIVT